MWNIFTLLWTTIAPDFLFESSLQIYSCAKKGVGLGALTTQRKHPNKRQKVGRAVPTGKRGAMGVVQSSLLLKGAPFSFGRLCRWCSCNGFEDGTRHATLVLSLFLVFDIGVNFLVWWGRPQVYLEICVYSFDERWNSFISGGYDHLTNGNPKAVYPQSHFSECENIAK